MMIDFDISIIIQGSHHLILNNSWTFIKIKIKQEQRLVKPNHFFRTNKKKTKTLKYTPPPNFYPQNFYWGYTFGGKFKFFCGYQ